MKSTSFKVQILRPLPFLRLTLQPLPVSPALGRIQGPSAIRFAPPHHSVTAFRRATTLLPGQWARLHRARLRSQILESGARHYLTHSQVGVDPSRSFGSSLSRPPTPAEWTFSAFVFECVAFRDSDMQSRPATLQICSIQKPHPFPRGTSASQFASSVDDGCCSTSTLLRCTASLRSTSTNRLSATSIASPKILLPAFERRSRGAEPGAKCVRFTETSGPALPTPRIHGTRRNHGHDGSQEPASNGDQGLRGARICETPRNPSLPQGTHREAPTARAKNRYP